MASQGGVLVAGLALGIAIGLGSGYAWFARAPAAVPPLGDSDSGAGDVALRGAEVPAAPRAIETAIAAGDAATRPVATPAAIADLDRVLATLPRPEVAPGSGRIEGVVQSVAGEPLPGVIVVADLPRAPASVQASGGASSSPDGSLADAVLATVAEHHRAQATRRRAETGSDGRFALTGLQAAETYALYPAKDGWEPARRFERVLARAGDQVRITMTQVVAVPVRVVHVSGRPVNRARLRVEQFQGGATHVTSMRFEEWTAAASACRLAPGRYRLTAEDAPAHGGAFEPADVRSERVEVEGSVAAAPAAITLTLQPRPGLRGRVVGALPADPEQLHVVALEQPPGAAPDLLRLRRDGRDAIWVIDGAERTYRLDDLTPGRWLVGVAIGWDGDILAHAVVDIGESTSEVNLTLPEPDLASTVPVRVLGSDGSPLRDCHFDLLAQLRRGGVGLLARLEATRRPDGSYLINRAKLTEAAARHTPAWRAPDALALRVRSDSAGSQVAALNPTAQAPLAVQMAAPGRLRVTVADYAGSDVAGHLALRLERLDGAAAAADGFSEPESAPVLVPPEGVLELGPEQPGACRLWIGVRPSEDRYGNLLPAATSSVTLASGPQSRRIVAPAVYTVRLSGPELGPGGQLALWVRDEGNVASGFMQAVTAAVGEDREAHFRRVPAGAYYVGEDPYGRAMRLDVRSPTREVYAPTTPNALRVYLVDSQGRLAQAGFQDGDVVFGVAGRPFQGLDDLNAAMAGNADGALALDIERHGQRLVLSVTRGQMRPDGPGGQLLPHRR